MTSMRFGMLMAAAVTLAGCETGPSRQQVLAAMVGRPESDAIRAFGAPQRMIEANGHRFIAYEDTGVGYVPTAPFGPFGFGYGYGYGFGPAAFPIVRSCETTLEIVGGRVVSWTLRGNACD
ncbi:MAG: hypothetical protein ACRYG8_07320 [Janthinobacterium lividum]